MSMVFRAATLSKSLWGISSQSSQKINLNLSFLNSNCRCKAAVALTPSLRLNYSSKSDANKTTCDDNNNEKELIYKGLLVRNIRNIKLFSLSTSVVGITIQPFVYTKALAAGTVSSWTLPAFGFIGFLAIITPILLHGITKRYVLSVDYVPNSDKYIATVYNFFAMKKKIEFTPDDVTIPTVLGMFTTCAIKGHKVFLDSRCFDDQEHYIRIMGYDKPLDLQPNNEKSKKITN